MSSGRWAARELRGELADPRQGKVRVRWGMVLTEDPLVGVEVLKHLVAWDPPNLCRLERLSLEGDKGVLELIGPNTTERGRGQSRQLLWNGASEDGVG